MNVDRVAGFIGFVVFIVFVAATIAIRGSEIKSDYQQWRQNRLAVRAATVPSQKGLRNHTTYVLEIVLWSLAGLWVLISAFAPSSISIGTALVIIALATFIRTRR